MALVSLKVSKEDFQRNVDKLVEKIAKLDDIIQRYGQAKNNLTQFVEEGDSSYQSWCERIDVNVNACRASKVALEEQKAVLEKTIEEMEGMGGQLKSTLESAKDAAVSTVKAAIKVEGIL